MAAMKSQTWARREQTQKEFQTSFIRDDHLSDVPLLDRINWLNCIIVFGIPLVALYGLCTLRQFVWQTWAWAVVYYFWTGLGITAGYHRLWSHRSYSASRSVSWFLMFGGSGALEGSVKWWCLLHRAHHRWTDTDSDPYNSRRGFLYAHVGWLLLDNIRISGRIPMDDLRRNPLIRWQHANYWWFGPFAALIFPTMTAGILWGDLRGGFFIAGALRLMAVHHATWCVNSVAHYFGEHTFDDTISPRDHFVTGLLTLGEGYHNFHHEFPNDYRNGIHFWDYDPTKWFIFTLNRLGLTSGLKVFPQNEIVKGELEMMAKDLRRKMDRLDYGVDVDSLPLWTRSEWERQAECAKKERRVLVLERGVVYDVTRFLAEGQHPGGKLIVAQRHGQDVTEEFNGAVYNHTNAARNLMSHFRIARVSTAKME